MTRVLVTGGTGVLGSAIVRGLLARGVAVRLISRRAKPGDSAQVEWVQGNLLGGADLRAAFEGVDVIIHSATSQKAKEDVEVTRRVLELAQGARVKHALYVSIVGIDTLGFFDYYAAKLEGEQLFTKSGLPYSVQRATQFHDFVAYLLGLLGVGPVMVLPKGATLQPVDAAAVGEHIAGAALEPPAGRLPDLAGPETQTLEHLARAWLAARGERKPLLSLPIPLPVFKAISSGKLVPERAEHIGITWEAWLATNAAQHNPYRQRGRV